MMQWSDADGFGSGAVLRHDERRPAALRPPATGAWREGDPPAARWFVDVPRFSFETGSALPIRIAYETWGELNSAGDNAVLVLHALTGDAHVEGPRTPGQPTPGWWPGLIGPGAPLDTRQWFVIAPNMLGGCQGTTGPSSIAADGREFGGRFPRTTIRDQVRAQEALADALGITRFAAVLGGSMGGMHALEWAVAAPERVARLAVFAAPAVMDAQTIAQNTLQADAIRLDPAWAGGDYYDAGAGEGPYRGLALARRLAMLTYRGTSELDERFGRSWQSDRSPGSGGGRYSVESYLDFHGNRFTRRFDANSYITLSQAMNSHDIGRGRGGVAEALARVQALTLVVGVNSDALFRVAGQHRIAAGVPRSISGDRAVVLESPFGHDGFLLELRSVGAALRELLATDAGLPTPAGR